jgi:hypothetical protein
MTIRYALEMNGEYGTRVISRDVNSNVPVYTGAHARKRAIAAAKAMNMAYPGRDYCAVPVGPAIAAACGPFRVVS